MNSEILIMYMYIIQLFMLIYEYIMRKIISELVVVVVGHGIGPSNCSI